MPRPKRKTKAEDLARVRNNQRRSRERKRAHVVELEEKVQRLEAAVAVAVAGADASTASPSLEVENCFLKGLLESVGVDRGVLEGYLQGSLQQYSASVSDERGDSGVLDTYGINYTGQLNGAVAAIEPPVEPPVNESVTFNPELFGPLDLPRVGSARTPEWTDMPPTNMLQSQAIPSSTGYTITKDLTGMISSLDGEKSGSKNSVDSETTLCSVAFHLIIQCNRTGKDVLQLETKLRTGYTMPSCPGEGCRVENRVLLGVLAELV